MSEIWKYIIGYEGLYKISSLGNIKSNYKSNRTKNKGHLSDGSCCSLRNGKGYKFVTLYKNGVSKQFMIHRLIGIHFIPNPDNKPQINHIDGDKHNNSIYNLEWVTNSENHLHSARIGIAHIGVKNSMAKLSEEDVIKIRYDYKNGIAPRFIAKEFKIRRSYVHAIVKKQVWAHL